uniref:Uncharacterized protein n=1 Tax=Utricularia reniformis TaxID=192314 RepID=A0A1Y0B2V4_9LAMI|nr:hypothetical protein AEK19_MT1536 [Utricularia reniformis]ART31724.1 hypothetical protein AEK19_MT1536 [Utricularia reniformis]
MNRACKRKGGIYFGVRSAGGLLVSSRGSMVFPS